MAEFSHLPYLIIVRGVPGSGKSYIADVLQKTIGASAVIIDPDMVDTASEAFAAESAALARDGIDEKFHVYRYLRKRANSGIAADKVIIWNQAFNNVDGLMLTIQRMREHAESIGKQLPVLIVDVTVDKETARRRIDARTSGGGHAVPDAALDEFFAQYQPLVAAPYPTLQIDGGGDAQEIVRAIFAKI